MPINKYIGMPNVAMFFKKILVSLFFTLVISIGVTMASPYKMVVNNTLIYTCTARNSNNFEVASNWNNCGGGVPTSTDDVIIPAGKEIEFENDGSYASPTYTKTIKNLYNYGTIQVDNDRSNSTLTLKITGSFYNYSTGYLYRDEDVGTLTLIDIGKSFINSGNFSRDTKAIQFKVGEHINNTGTITATVPTASYFTPGFILTGAAGTTQKIFGTNTPTFANLTISNNVGVLMSVGVDVKNTLALGTGVVYLNENTLKLYNSSVSALTYSTGGIVSEDNVAPTNGSKFRWYVGSTGRYYIPFQKATVASLPYIYNGGQNRDEWEGIHFSASRSAAAIGGLAVPMILNITASNTASYVDFSTYSPGSSNLTPYPASVTHLKRNDSTDTSPYMTNRFWEFDIPTGSTLVGTATYSYQAGETASHIQGNNVNIQKWGTTGWKQPSGATIITPVSSGTFLANGVSLSSTTNIMAASFSVSPLAIAKEVKWIPAAKTKSSIIITEGDFKAGDNIVAVGVHSGLKLITNAYLNKEIDLTGLNDNKVALFVTNNTEILEGIGNYTWSADEESIRCYSNSENRLVFELDSSINEFQFSVYNLAGQLIGRDFISGNVLNSNVSPVEVLKYQYFKSTHDLIILIK